MSRLVLAELRRVAARRPVRLVVLLVVIGVALGGLVAFASSGPLSEAAYQRRVADADARQQALRSQVQACLRARGVTPDAIKIPDAEARRCFPDGRPSAHDPRFHRQRLKGVLQGVSGVLAIVGWALGASLIGAEFASRGMTTTLTWETRRLRVLGAKIAAAFAASAGLALLALVLVGLAMWPSAAWHGAPVRPGEAPLAALAGIGGRGVALAALAAGMGFAVATIGRNTAAALGAGFAYIVILENILGSSVPRWRRWLLLGNVIVFISGTNHGGEVPGRSVFAAACS